MRASNQDKANHINFTVATLDKLLLPKDGKRKTYHDKKESGLIIIVTSKGNKTFFLYKRIDGKPERVMLGKYPDIKIEQARKAAAKEKGEIAQGINPQIAKRSLRHDITFAEMFNEYMERYSKKHKKSWKADEREINRFLPHWMNKKASSIRKQDVQHIHEKIHDENGLYQANRLFEKIRSIYNKSIEWGWHGANPTMGIKKYTEKSRDRFLQADELPRLFNALAEEENTTARDYILISLLTGARKTNVLSMQWDEINFTTKQWRIPETKNGEPLTIPLVSKAIEILKERKERSVSDEWVFPSPVDSKKHLADPKRAWKRVLDSAEIENLRIHDLRRTLGSWQAATGATTAIIGKSLGHKSKTATAIYERLNLDPVRAAYETATDAMWGCDG